MPTKLASIKLLILLSYLFSSTPVRAMEKPAPQPTAICNPVSFIASVILKPSGVRTLSPMHATYYLPEETLPASSKPLLKKWLHTSFYNSDYGRPSEAISTLLSADESEVIQRKLHHFTYQNYEKIISPEELTDMKSFDQKLDLGRMSWITFDVTPGDPKSAIRLYDGSVHPNVPLAFGKKKLNLNSPAKIEIEFEYPKLILPDGNKIQIGRLSKLNPTFKSLETSFSWAAQLLQHTYPKEDFTLYAECLENRLQWYVNGLHFDIIGGTKLPVSPTADHFSFQLIEKKANQKDRFILSMKKSDLIKYHGRSLQWPSQYD